MKLINKKKEPISIEQYKTLIEETAVYPEQVDNFGLAYCWLGLIGETDEAVSAIHKYSLTENTQNHLNMTKEVGDVLWYTTAICRILKLDLEYILYESYCFTDSVNPHKSICTLCEDIKKYYRDGKTLDTAIITKALNINIQLLLLSSELDINNVMIENYSKLMRRKLENTIHGDGDNR